MEDPKSDQKRLNVFQTLLSEFATNREVSSFDFDLLEKAGENGMLSSDENQKEVEKELYNYLKKSTENKLQLMEILLRLFQDEANILQDDTIVHRCGCVIYTMFYKYMLDLNNIPRYGRHISCIDANAEASFRKNLQNHAFKEAIEAIKILETALIIAVGNSSDSNLQCFVGFVPFYPKSLCDVQKHHIVDKVSEIVCIESALQYIETQSKMTETNKSNNCFSLLNKNGGIRKGKEIKVVDNSEQSIPVKKRKSGRSSVMLKKNYQKTTDSDAPFIGDRVIEDDEGSGVILKSISSSTKCAQSFVTYKGKHFFLDGPPLDVYGSGNSARQHYEKERYVIIELKHYLIPELLNYAHTIMLDKATKVRNSSQRPSKIRNNYRLVPSSDVPIRDDGRRTAYTVNYLDHYGENKFRCSDGQTKDELLQFSQVVHWILSLVKDVGDGIIPDNVQACSSTGVPNSLHLIVALPNCLSQHFHYDYNLKKFDGASFKGSSLFINFRNEWATMDIGICEHDPTIRKQLRIPPISILVFRGDFKHAGSLNSHSTDEIWKFFMYLDPFQAMGNFRKENSNTLYYDCYDDLSYILWPEERTLLRAQERV